ncbi:MAG: hypothetical protein F6K54_33935 [Okeania sp. SIO3B5]|uniref:SPFH domain-containing protein n=1 Tax=Okeania sp. SIO3B5 TaxID=2607811 RepID=UPI0013FE8A51|nr:SPFH domain-containing protein [Okeania sp. SIO3B5]NEO57633.1 hypothetical protein [Okeania sp. SIO3B5]
MPEEKLLFVEKKLNRWKRPEPPQPGSALVFTGGGQPFVVYEGEQGLTQGELLFGKYSKFYEVDMGDRRLNFDEKLPCADGLEFHAEVRLTYAVSDPVVILRRARTDADQFLKDIAIEVMRRTSRRYTHEQSREAENAIVDRIEHEVRDKGFKPIGSAFVTLSLDEEVKARLVNRKLKDYDFEDEKTQISRNFELNELQQTAEFRLKLNRAGVFADLIKSGDWPTLLAMVDPNDPADQKMLDVALNQQEIDGQRKQEFLKDLKDLIEKGKLEVWQLHEFAKLGIGGLSEQSLAYLESKSESSETEDSQQIHDVKPSISIPDDISRDKDD